MAERTELKPLPVKVRGGLIASGTLDIIYFLFALVINLIIGFIVSGLLFPDLSSVEGSIALIVVYILYCMPFIMVITWFLLLPVLIVMLAFGIITITLCARKPEVFGKKKKLLITSLVFTSVVFLFQFVFMLSFVFSADTFVYAILIFSMPIASIVLKSLALAKKEFVEVPANDQPASTDGNAFFLELKELQLRRERGLISGAEYEARRAEIAARNGERQDAVRRLQTDRTEGRLTEEEYERRRKLIMAGGTL